MGWFKITPETLTDNFRFSSPLGDGLVQDVKIIKTAITNIFVPEWGWVGSQWVHGARTTKKFSSPSGDRLVPIEDVHAYNEIEIFVPAWGWVGSGVRFSSLG